MDYQNIKSQDDYEKLTDLEKINYWFATAPNNLKHYWDKKKKEWIFYYDGDFMDPKNRIVIYQSLPKPPELPVVDSKNKKKFQQMFK